MKECKVIRINDGNPVVLTNGERHFAEEYTWAEEKINEYLADGYILKQIIPIVDPNVIKEGALGFYKGGIMAYFEKEI